MAFIMAFGIAGVQDVRLVPVLLALGAVALWASGQARTLGPRLRGPLLVALALVAVLPLAAGTVPLARLGPLTWHADGLALAGLLAGRLLAIVAMTLALLAPVPPFRLVAALRALHVPPLLADLALLTLRYLAEMRSQLARAQLARRLRGGQGTWRALPEQALLLAACLIRAQGRGEQVWAAMRLRGHATGLAAPDTPLGARDIAALALASALACALLIWGRAP